MTGFTACEISLQRTERHRDTAETKYIIQYNSVFFQYGITHTLLHVRYYYTYTNIQQCTTLQNTLRYSEV